MKFNLSAFLKCPSHGHHGGDVCPLCDHESGFTVAAEIKPEVDRSKWFDGPEKQLHDSFESWLGFQSVEFVHCRTDKESTIENGWPDFTCIKNGADGITRACLVEFKNRAGKLRKDQVEVIDRQTERAIPVLVTGNFLEACDFVKLNLAIP